MVTEERLNTLLAHANPVADVSKIDLIEVGAATYLATLEQRSSEVTQLDTEQKEPTSPKRSMVPWLIAAALAAVVGVAIIVYSQNSGEVPVVDQPTPTTVVDAAPTTAAEPTPTTLSVEVNVAADAALDISESFVAAHNAGDFDGVMVLFTEDATFSDTDTSPSRRPDWEPRIAWDLAGEDMLLSHECVVTDEVPGVTVTVTCEYGSQDAVRVAAEAIVDITATLTITPDGISHLREDYADSVLDYADIGQLFSAWLVENFPEDADAAGCCEGETIEESVTRGELRAQYAREWAIYLADNN